MASLGVASGTAGLISLGLTVCQSLLDYYHSWKHAEDDVAKTYASIEQLFRTLRLLAVAVEYKEFNGEVLDQVRDSIRSAEERLHSLEKKLDKVRVVALQNSWRGKAKAQFRRTLYPFKESTLAKLRELSSETRDNLNLALNLLQIDTSAASLRELDLLGRQAASVSTNVDNLTQQSTSISKNVHDIANYTKETTGLIEKLASNESSKELRAWLSGHLDPTQKQYETWRERHPDTGHWFLQGRTFRAWLEGPVQQTPRVLNIIGKSGAGKTSLISTAIKAAQAMGNHSRIAVAYFYCSFNEAASQDPAHMVGSVISQVSTVCQNMLEGLEVGVSRGERPTLGDLEQRLTSQTAHSSLKILLFIDGVNECKNIEPMINSLLRLAESMSDIRVLFTSTEEDPLITALTDLQPPKATTLRMSAMSVDIDVFIDSKIEEKRNLRRLPPEMKREIKVELSRKANGM
ncbi:hypothetical protein IMSHALPRED_006369 [Imshaugia aleurites]|uniref:Nephrocystin 3-like N-terminal domain-containing protein n=1 Tax=Imshaugia aleurites TaxID=172621 RepID=A0A8H3FFG4_9LECA|nr:hypothetical protein IMSHALPRED_006369 [Imshaugia aleurites]